MIPDSWVIAVFLLIYVFISIQRFPFIKIDRPAGVFTGVTLLVLTGVITLTEGYSFINWDVITFLLGMMIMVSYLQTSGFFSLAATYIVRVSGTPNRLLIGVIISTALLSALFVNDTVCLLFTPIILASARCLKVNPMPYLIAVAISSNIGSGLIVTGNPQNMYIGIVSKIAFLDFTLRAAAPVFISLIAAYIIIWLFYRADMRVAFKDSSVPDIQQIDKPLMFKSLAALTFTIILFIVGVSYPFASLIGATLVILSARIKPAAAFKKIDWPILLFFAGLFIIMGAFGKMGYTDSLLKLTGGALDTSSLSGLAVFSGVTVLLSNLVSNLPAVILIAPFLGDTLPADSAVLLALISTFAGNLTLIGSVANLIVAERAESDGVHFSFIEHMKVGVPVTIVSCAISVLWVYLL